MKPLTLTLSAFTLAGLATAALAVAPEKGAVLGTDAAQISAALAADGYQISRYRAAPALIQVTAVKDGEKHFMLVSTRDGAVIKHKTGSAAPADPAAATALTVPAVPAELAEKLAAQGYELRRVKNEGYELEAYALRDGRMYELKLDPATGDILRVEAED